jgi:hypothetical protein
MQRVHERIAIAQIFWCGHHDPRWILCGLGQRPAFAIERRPIAGDNRAQNGLGVCQLLAHHALELRRLIGHRRRRHEHDHDGAEYRTKSRFHIVPSRLERVEFRLGASLLLAFAAPQGWWHRGCLDSKGGASHDWQISFLQRIDDGEPEKFSVGLRNFSSSPLFAASWRITGVFLPVGIAIGLLGLFVLVEGVFAHIERPLKLIGAGTIAGIIEWVRGTL